MFVERTLPNYTEGGEVLDLVDEMTWEDHVTWLSLEEAELEEADHSGYMEEHAVPWVVERWSDGEDSRYCS